PKTDDKKETVLVKFTPDLKPITTEIDGRKVTTDKDGWRIENSGSFGASESTSSPRVRLFETPKAESAGYKDTFRAKVRSEKIGWARFCLRDRDKFDAPGFFESGNRIEGSTNWTDYEFSCVFLLDETPKGLEVQLTMGSAGTVWIKDFELVKT